MPKLLILVAGISIFLAACGAKTVDIRATAELLSHTIVVKTQSARPSETPLPTAQDNVSDSPTKTAVPSATLSASLAPPKAAIENTSTATLALPKPSETAWFNPNKTARLRFENTTDQVIFLKLKGPKSGDYSFSTSWNLTSPWGAYEYMVWIENDGPFTGTFKITNADKYTIVIREDKVIVLYP